MRTALTMNARGTITLPKKLRERYGLNPTQPVILETRPDGILLRPAVSIPIEIYTIEREQEFDAAEKDLNDYMRRNQDPSD